MHFRGSAALGCMVSALFASAAAAQGAPHMEECTLTESWDIRDGTFGVKNICDEPLAIQFMTEKNQRATRADLNPGARFDTGLSKAQVGAGWWMFTTCPAGTTSDIAFTVTNRGAVVDGNYKCIRKPRAESRIRSGAHPV